MNGDRFVILSIRPLKLLGHILLWRLPGMLLFLESTKYQTESPIFIDPGSSQTSLITRAILMENS